MNKKFIKTILLTNGIFVNLCSLFISNNYVATTNNCHIVCNNISQKLSEINSNINVNDNWIKTAPEQIISHELVGLNVIDNKLVVAKTGWIKIFTNSYYVENETDILNLVISRIVITPNYVFDENEKNNMLPKDLYWPNSIGYYAGCKTTWGDMELYDYFPKQRNPEWSISYNLLPDFSIGSGGLNLGVSVSYSASQICPEIINQSSMPDDWVHIEFNYDINKIYIINDLKNYVCRETTQIVSTLYKVKKNPN